MWKVKAKQRDSEAERVRLERKIRKRGSWLGGEETRQRKRNEGRVVDTRGRKEWDRERG